jgi:hypothetical protein
MQAEVPRATEAVKQVAVEAERGHSNAHTSHREAEGVKLGWGQLAHLKWDPGGCGGKGRCQDRLLATWSQALHRWDTSQWHGVGIRQGEPTEPWWMVANETVTAT